MSICDSEQPSEDYDGQSESPNIESDFQFKFHPTAGRAIMLLEDGLYARRSDPRYGAADGVVLGSQPIPNRSKCILEVTITEFESRWFSRSIQIGIIRQPKGKEIIRSAIPMLSEDSKKSCVWIGNEVCNSFNDNEFLRHSYGVLNLNKDLKQG